MKFCRPGDKNVSEPYYPLRLGRNHRVLHEMVGKQPNQALVSILQILDAHSELVEPDVFRQPVCTDPDDDKFLEAAVTARAAYVVSGDTALLRVRSYEGVRIVKPREFIGLLPSG